MKLLWAVFWPKVGHLNRCLISTIDTNQECLYQYIKEQSSSDLYEFSSSSRAGISLEKLSSFHFFFDDLLFYLWRCFFFFSLFTFHFSLLGFYLRFILCARFDEENETEKCCMHSSYVDSFVEWRAKTLLELLLMFAVLLVICWSVESGVREKKCAHFLYISAICSFIVWNFLVVDRKNCQREKRVKTGIETRHSIAALDIFFSKYLCTSLTILK